MSIITTISTSSTILRNISFVIWEHTEICFCGNRLIGPVVIGHKRCLLVQRYRELFCAISLVVVFVKTFDN